MTQEADSPVGQYEPELLMLARHMVWSLCMMAEIVVGQTVIRSDEIRLVHGQDIVLSFRLPKGPEGAFLALEGRLEMPPHKWRGGSMPCVDYVVNDHKLVDLSRLVNVHNAGDVATFGGQSLCWRGVYGNWRLPYSPDWKPFSAENTLAELGRNPYAHILDITDRVRPGENELRIRHNFPHWDMAQMAFRNIRVLPCYDRPEAPSGVRDVPGLDGKPVTPRTDHRVDYEAEVRTDGGISITVSGDRYLIASVFSCPAVGLQRLGAPSTVDRPWDVHVREGTVSASCNTFRLQREITRHPDRVEVRDHLSNLTDDVIGVRLGHEMVVAKADLWKTYLHGALVPLKEGRASLGVHTTENPTVYVCTRTSGVGLLPRDTVFRAHVSLDLRDGAYGIHDRFFALAPRSGYTLRWEIYPTARPDYYDFINAARRALEANYLIDGNLAFAHGHIGNMQRGHSTDRRPITEEMIRGFVAGNGLRYVGLCTISRLDKAGDRVSGQGMLDFVHGTAFMADVGTWNRHWLKQVIRTYRRLCPDAKLVPYIDPFVSSEPGAERIYEDSVAMNANGTAQRYTSNKLHVMYPTLENSYGRALGRFFDYLLEHADGFYMDESTMYENVKAGSFSYRDDTWDGHSCIMDLGSGPEEEGASYALRRTVTSSALYTLPFRLAQLRKANALGKSVWMNFAPIAEEETALQSYRFVEAYANNAPIYSHLSSPLSLANEDLERSQDDIGRSVRTKLLYGGLYLNYSIKYEVGGNILQDIYPIHPIELHCGYVIGVNKIVTCVPGEYGFGDGVRPTVTLYDPAGFRIEGRAGTLRRTSRASLATVDLREGEMAIVWRGHSGD